MKRDSRKPLVVMTPKSLLRHPLAVSKLSEMTSGGFREILHDLSGTDNPRRVIMCSGKIYYDLLQRRDAAKASDIALVRVEQFYPFPREQIKEVIHGSEHAQEWLWVQEEPENMGGWSFMQPRLQALTDKKIKYVGRPASASPATGYHATHKREQSAIVDQAVA
jgi:2-oxoglutarate dehydrogenase E1 component